MKKIILALLLFLLVGCSNTKYNGVVNVLNWSSYIPDEVIENFEKEYNIKVNYGTYLFFRSIDYYFLMTFFYFYFF